MEEMVIELITARGTTLWINGEGPKKFTYGTIALCVPAEEAGGKVRGINTLVIHDGFQIDGADLVSISIEGEASKTDPRSLHIWGNYIIPDKMVVKTTQTTHKGEVKEAIAGGIDEASGVTAQLQNGTLRRLSEIELYMKATISKQ